MVVWLYVQPFGLRLPCFRVRWSTSSCVICCVVGGWAWSGWGWVSYVGCSPPFVLVGGVKVLLLLLLLLLLFCALKNQMFTWFDPKYPGYYPDITRIFKQKSGYYPDITELKQNPPPFFFSFVFICFYFMLFTFFFFFFDMSLSFFTWLSIF